MTEWRYYVLAFVATFGFGVWWVVCRTPSQAPPTEMPAIDTSRFHDVAIFVDGHRAGSDPIEITPFRNHSVTGTFRAAADVTVPPNLGAGVVSARRDFRGGFGFALPVRRQPDGSYQFGGQIATIEFDGVVELRLTATMGNNMPAPVIGRVLLRSASVPPPGG